MNRTSSPRQTDILARWARVAVRHRRLVLAAWVVGLILLIGVAGTFGGTLSTTFEVPGTESQRAFDLLHERFPQQAGDGAIVVFHAESGLAEPAIRERIESVLAQAAVLPGVTTVSSPFGADGRGALSGDGRIGYATVQYGEQASSVPKADVDRLFALVDGAGDGGLTVEAGGAVVQALEQQPPGSKEAIGLLIAAVILLVAFGSVVAMGLPIATALVGLGAGFALAGLAALSFDVSQFTLTFGIMIGLGVGIDYALFVVTRFRDGLREGHGVEDSIVLAIATAGRAVIFAGLVVMLALLGTAANGIPAVTAFGITGSLFVAMGVLVALTLLPALLGVAGRRVNSLRVPFLREGRDATHASVWYGLARGIQRRPLPWFLGAFAVLLALAAPVLDMNLGFSDAGNSPTSMHSRRAYDLLAEGFGPGFNAPLVIALDLRDAGPDAAAAVDEMRTVLMAREGVADVSPPLLNPSGDTAIISVTPAFAPQDDATDVLITDLRDGVVPSTLAGTRVTGYVSGPTAAFMDVGDRLIGRLPYSFGSVLVLSFLLLVVVFRSVLVAAKAVVMNLLSIGAAYGVLVAVFQWGWFSNIVGVKEGPIETFLPMLLFSVLFGLSMDYEVFLISRIREEYDRTGDSAASVAHGLAATARVITAAAAVMVMVFLSFALGPLRTIKEIGLGLAVAILVDATIVRLILVPATMELLGDANWWLPRWLDRVLPHLNLEGGAHEKSQPGMLDRAA